MTKRTGGDLPDESPQRVVLTVEEWAEKMRISRGAAYQAVKNGDVRVIRIGRLLRIPNEAV